MKTKIILFFLFFISNFLTYNLFGQTPKYVLFDNFDSWATQAYWEPLQKSEHIAFFQKRTFNSTFFSQNNLTDFDVAIFPLGDNGVNTSVGQYNVLTEINRMIAAGKNVIIISRKAISKESSSDFFKNTLGIQFLESKYNFSPGDSRYLGFISHGASGCEVGLGSIKYVNQGNGNNNTWPWVFYQYHDIFKINDFNKTSYVDHYCQLIQDQRINELVGSKTVIGSSKIIFWSIGFENFAGDATREQLLDRAVRWLMPGAPKAGPNIVPLSTNIEFGSIKVGGSAESTLGIQNVGDKDLIISDIYIDGSLSEPGTFEITDGDKVPITLKSFETHSIAIKFTPKKDGEDYTDFIVIESNDIDVNDRKLEVILFGSGGDIGKGPKIASNFEKDILDFGRSYLSVDTILIISNQGDEAFTINKIEIIDNKDEAFNFQQVIKVPIELYPNQSVGFKTRFAASMLDNGIYTARIKFETNIANQKEFYVNLIGKIGGGPEIVSNVKNFAIKFGKSTNDKDTVLELSNKGNEKLIINNIEFFDNDTGAFKFLKSLNLPIEIEPNEKVQLQLRFSASTLSKGIYYANLLIESNAANIPKFSIELTGESTRSTDVFELSGKSNDGFYQIFASPNPAIDYVYLLTEFYTSEENIIRLYKEFIVSIYNPLGELVESITVPAVNYFVLNTSNYSPGQYFIVVKVGTSTAAAKLVVVH